MVRSCHVCQCVQNAAPLPPLQPWPASGRVFERVHLDFAQKYDVNFILVDDYSKWIEAKLLSSTTAQKTIEQLQVICAQFGLPEEIVTDNGPQFVSDEFENFVKENVITHTTTPPYHASSNGLAERAVQTLKQELLKQVVEDNCRDRKRILQHKLSNFLFQYRTTPHTATGKTPAELFLGCLPRTRLVMLKPGFSRTRREKQNKMKRPADKRRSKHRKFEVGDSVWVKNTRGEEVNWSPGKVIKKVSDVTFLVRVHGKVRYVHCDHLKLRFGATLDSEDSQPLAKDGSSDSASSDDEYFDADDDDVERNDPELQRNTRVTKPPNRLTYETRRAVNVCSC